MTITMQFPLIKIENNIFSIRVEKEFYTQEAILAVIYKYSGDYYIHEHNVEDTKTIIEIIFESKNGNEIEERIPKQFCNDLVDEMVRANVEKQFGHIRDLIVEEAFKPVNK